MNKTAIITGVTGQDGSYLAELLLNYNYKVTGLHRRSSTNNFERINNILKHPNFNLEEFDLTDPNDISYIINKYQPTEFYNLAAQSHVGTSFKQPTTTFEIDTIGVINLLESIKRFSKHTRFYQASTSEMFGSNFSIRNNDDGTTIKIQDENTTFLPQSPYAVAKLSSHRLVQIYREAYGLYVCSGILFNHESPRRGENFVTRKITKYIGQLINGAINSDTKLKLGNLSSSRDWGHAKDYVEAMYLMLQQNQNPEDFVICSGQTKTVEEFLELAFNMVNLDYRNYISIDPELYRPCEVDYLRGCCSKAKKILNWETRISFEELVKDMVDSDIKRYAS
jgi:GDPmannose 4,6-dehydratase